MKNEEFHVQNSNIVFTNFVYDKSKYYFLLISELKAYGIGHYFQEALSKNLRIPKNDIEFISIAPDVFEQYNFNNLIIINDSSSNENRRKNHDDFVKDISENNYIDNLIDKILLNQNELFLYMFESSPFMTLDEKDGVTLIGPNHEIVTTFSNKISLYEIFSDVVPMAPFAISKGFDELFTKSKEFIQSSADNVFISLEKSAAGANSMIANDIKDIKAKFEENRDDDFLITKFIPHVFDPTTLGVVINEDEIYVAGVADQKINGTKFVGSSYPSKLSTIDKKEVIRQTRVVGKKMAKLGYRGIFGCDFIVTNEGAVYFIETNPRKQGTTMEFCCTLRNILPIDAPNLPELEFYAVTKNQAAPNMVEPDFSYTNIFWRTYNNKITSKLETYGYLPQQNNEIEMFDKVAKNKINKEFMILEHIGHDFFVNEGSFLGRIIAVGKSYKDIDDGIDMGRRMIHYTIKNSKNDDFVADDKCYSCHYYNSVSV